MSRWLHPPELKRRDQDRFDPLIEGDRGGLPRDLSVTVWERACAEATDGGGRLDLEQAQRRFHELAARAARGEQLQLTAGRLTRLGVESDDGAGAAWIARELGPSAPGKRTLAFTEARQRRVETAPEDGWARAAAPIESGPRLDWLTAHRGGARTPIPGRRTLSDPVAHFRPSFDDYRVLGLRNLLKQLGPEHRLRREVIAAAASADRTIAGRATYWRELLAVASTPDGADLWRAAERHAVTLYRRALGSGTVNTKDPAVEAALKRCGTGQSLPEQLRSKLEPQLGVSLSGVRIHTDAVAAQAARALSAEAFTIGEDIFFAIDAYAPETPTGRKLLLHELTHVAQALRGAQPPAIGGLHVSQPDEPHEREAEAVAERLELAAVSWVPACAAKESPERGTRGPRAARPLGSRGVRDFATEPSQPLSAVNESERAAVDLPVAESDGERVAPGRPATAPASATVPPLPATDARRVDETTPAVRAADVRAGAPAHHAGAEGMRAVSAETPAGAGKAVAADGDGATPGGATGAAGARPGSDKPVATAASVSANAHHATAASAAAGVAGAAAQPVDAAAGASATGAEAAAVDAFAGDSATAGAAVAGAGIDGAADVGAAVQANALAANGATAALATATRAAPPSPIVLEEQGPSVTAAWEARRAAVMSPIEPRPIAVDPNASISTALEGQWAVIKARMPDPGMFQEKAPAPQLPTPPAPTPTSDSSLAPIAPLSQRGADTAPPTGSGTALYMGQAQLATSLRGPHVVLGTAPHANAPNAPADTGLQARPDSRGDTPTNAGTGASQQPAHTPTAPSPHRPERRDAGPQDTSALTHQGKPEHPARAVDPAARQRDSDRRSEETKKRSEARRRRLAAMPLQTKLVVGGADSAFEREADDAADRVMSQGDAAIIGRAAPEIQRLAAHRPTASDDAIGEGELPVEIESRIERLGSGGGRPMSVAERVFFEPRFGHDLGETRIHEGGEAAELTQLLGARAFAVGHQIVLGAGEGGDSTEARRLLAHELAHVIQQTGGNPRTAPVSSGAEGGDPARERDARAGGPSPAAVKLEQARLTPSQRGRAAAVVQRFSLSSLNPIDKARKLLDALRGDAEEEKAPLAAEGSSRSSEMNATAQSKAAEIEGDGRTKGSEIESDGRTKGSEVESDGRTKGSEVESQGRQRGSQVEAEGRQRGSQVEAEGRLRGGQVEAGGRQRGAEIEAESRARGAQLEIESRQRGAELDTETAAHRAALESEGAASEAEVRTEAEARRADLAADAETRGAELQGDAEARSAELQADYTELDQRARAEQQQVDAQVTTETEQVRAEAQSSNRMIEAEWALVEGDATETMRALDREAGEMCARYQGRAKDYVKSIDDSINSSVQSASTIISGFRAIQEEGERAWAAFLDQIGPTLRMLEQRGKQFADWARRVWEPIQRSLSELATRAFERGHWVLQKVQQGWDWLREKATKIFHTLREKTTAAVQWLATRGDAARVWIAQKAQAARQWIAQKARSARQWIAQKAQAVRDWIADKGDGARAWIHGKADAARQWIHTQADAARDWIHGKADAAHDWIHGKADVAREWIHDKGDAARNWVSSRADGARDWIHGKADAARAWIHGKADAATAWVSDKGHELVDGLTSMARGAVDRIASRGGPIMRFFAGAVNGIIDGVTSVGNAAVDGLSAAVDTGLSFVEDTVTSAIISVEDKATGAVTWVENKATGAVTWVENKATGAATWVENKATSAVTWVENRAAGAVTWVEDKATGAVTWVEDRATGAVTWVENRATGAVTWVENRATSAINVLESAGTAAVHGMKSAANGAVTTVKTAVKVGLGALSLAGRGATMLANAAWQDLQARWWLVENQLAISLWYQEKLAQFESWINDKFIQPSWQWIQARRGELRTWFASMFPGLTRCWEVFKEYAGSVSGYLVEKLAQFVAWLDSLPWWIQMPLRAVSPLYRQMQLAMMSYKLWNALPEPVRNALHLVIDIIGLVPELGAIAEACNAFLYLIDGNYVDAAISTISALADLVPGLGQGVVGAKMGRTLRLLVQSLDLYGSSQALIEAYEHFKAHQYFEGLTSLGEVLVFLIDHRKGGSGVHDTGSHETGRNGPGHETGRDRSGHSADSNGPGSGIGTAGGTDPNQSRGANSKSLDQNRNDQSSRA